MSETLFEQDSHAVVEVMGHQTFAGKISQHVLGGTAFIRVDVPEIAEEVRRETDWRGDTRESTIPAVPGFTKLIGASSIYAITPCSEDVAKQVSKQKRVVPVACVDFTPEIKTKLIGSASSTVSAVDEEIDHDFEDRELNQESPF